MPLNLAETTALEELTVETGVRDVDIRVKNAGIQRLAPLHDFDPEAWRFMHRLIAEFPFLLIRAALPGVYER